MKHLTAKRISVVWVQHGSQRAFKSAGGPLLYPLAICHNPSERVSVPTLSRIPFVRVCGAARELGDRLAMRTTYTSEQFIDIVAKIMAFQNVNRERTDSNDAD